jgi:hypothetical protein
MLLNAKITKKTQRLKDRRLENMENRHCKIRPDLLESDLSVPIFRYDSQGKIINANLDTTAQFKYRNQLNTVFQIKVGKFWNYANSIDFEFID